jgi:peptidoglycan-N-acetylmuramic acid deacetylase
LKELQRLMREDKQLFYESLCAKGGWSIMLLMKKHILHIVLMIFFIFLFLLSIGCSKSDKNTESSSKADSSSSPTSSTVTSDALNSSSNMSSSTVSAELKSSSIADTVDKQNLLGLNNTKIGWSHDYGVAKPATIQNMLTKYGVCWIGNRKSYNVYLTFDEGYEYGLTTNILDTLKAKNVKAVFFITLSYAKTNPQIVRRMIDEGHTLGNHSCNHPSFPDKDIDTDINEVSNLHNYIKNNYNYDMTLFRFPYGEYSERTLALVRSLNYTSVFWSFGYKDWDVKNQPKKEDALKLIEGKVHNGAIYLLHPESKTNADILPEVIDNFRERGYNIALLTGNFE